MTDDDRGATGPTLTPSQVIGSAPTSASSEAPAPQQPSGRLPERYVARSRLGAGGMGEVLLASDGQIGREVAIKRMLVPPTPSAVARFLREAKIQGRLDHPAIVPVHELATDSEGRPFFAMKRLTGTTLGDVLARGSTSRQKLLRAFADVCLAIELAHTRGIVHRDLKPANIMLGDFGEVYVIDWGVARVLDEADDLETASEAGATGATEAGAILGTPGYIAPELLRGQPLDTRADVYALGCILFEVLAGVPLLPRGRAALEVALAEIDARPSQRAPERDIPPELDAVCVEATLADREQRPTARGLAERIERFLDGDRDLALRRRLAADHVEAARAALAKGDGETERAAAMREAGRAIALDPASSDAAELVGRLILEPPRVVPKEVDDRLAELDEATLRSRATTVTIMFFCYLASLPVLAWLGMRSPSGSAMFAAAILVNALFGVKVIRQRRRISALDIQLAAIFNAFVAAIIARLFSPFIVAPGIAAVSAMMFALDGRMPLRLLIAMMVGAVLVPWALELAGVWSRTMHEVGGDLVLHAPAVTVRLPHTEIALAGYIASLIGISGIIAHRLGVAQRNALRSIELQAWHLRQLVRR